MKGLFAVVPGIPVIIQHTERNRSKRETELFFHSLRLIVRRNIEDVSIAITLKRHSAYISFRDNKSLLIRLKSLRSGNSCIELSMIRTLGLSIDITIP